MAGEINLAINGAAALLDAGFASVESATGLEFVTSFPDASGVAFFWGAAATVEIFAPEDEGIVDGAGSGSEVSEGFEEALIDAVCGGSAEMSLDVVAVFLEEALGAIFDGKGPADLAPSAVACLAEETGVGMVELAEEEEVEELAAVDGLVGEAAADWLPASLGAKDEASPGDFAAIVTDVGDEIAVELDRMSEEERSSARGRLSLGDKVLSESSTLRFATG